MPEKKVSVRFTAEGARIVRSEMDGLGTSGAQAFQKIDTGQKSAQISAETFARAIEQEEKSFKALRASLDPAFAAHQRFEVVVRDANRAVAQGVASHQDAAQVIALARRQLDASTAAMRGTAAAARDLDASVIAASAGLGSRGIAMQLSQVAQQASATGNVVQALAIQLPDLALGFGPLGIALGAAAGALLSFAVGAGRAREETQDLDRVSVSGIQSGIDELVALEARYADAIRARDLAQSSASDEAIAGIAREIAAKRDILAFERAQMEIVVERLKVEADAMQASLDAEVRARRGASETGARARENDAYVYSPTERRLVEETQAALDANRMQVLELRKANAELAMQEQALARVNGLLDKGRTEAEGVRRAADDTRLEVERQADAMLRAYAVYGETRAEAAAQREIARGMLADLRQQAQMSSLIAQYGADSREVALARAEAERAAYEEQVASLDISKDLADSLMEAWDAANGVAASDMASPLAAAADQASRLAGEIQRAVDNAVSLSAQGLSGLKESEIALRFKGDPVGRAGALARERFGDISGLDPILRGEMEKMRAEYVQSVQQTERNRQELADWQKMQAEAARSSPSTGGRGSSARGGGGGRNAAAREAEREAAAIRKVVENLQDEIDLFGADEQARKLNQELRRAGVELYSEEGQRIADLVEQLSELERQQEVTDRFLSDMQSISDALAQAIVNGENLGDAMGKVFRKMAADLLSSGLNNLFTSLFTGGGGGGLFGSIFGGGTQVAGREHGGRVTAGQPYIVGERRPELFVPDMSGTILPRVPQASAPAAAPQRVELVLHAAEGVTVETVRNEAGAMIRSYDRALPGRVKSINADPYAY